MLSNQLNRDGLLQWQQAAYQQQLGLPSLGQGAYQISFNQLGQAQWQPVDLRTREQIDSAQQAIAKMVSERTCQPLKKPIDYLAITRDIANSV
jgi:hypothetical protein